MTSSFRLANELQGHLLLPLLPIGCSFQEELLLQLIIELLASLRRVSFSNGSNQAKGNPLEMENKLVPPNRVHDCFLAGFLTSVNATKSEHDFVFRPWGETLGCVPTPAPQ